jgi:hypothetical protein
MKAIRRFEEFIKEGVVKKQSPNRSRAEFLVLESEKNYSFLLELLDKIQINNNNANNYIKQCYDIIMELIRAKMLLEGYNASGFSAHEAEVSYLRLIEFKEVEVQFVDQMRYFRNGMLYYGTLLDKEYADKVIKFTKESYSRLKKIIKL